MSLCIVINIHDTILYMNVHEGTITKRRQSRISDDAWVR